METTVLITLPSHVQLLVKASDEHRANEIKMRQSETSPWEPFRAEVQIVR